MDYAAYRDRLIERLDDREPHLGVAALQPLEQQRGRAGAASARNAAGTVAPGAAAREMLSIFRGT